MQQVTIQILYADAAFIAVNKPPGVAVHAAPGPGSSVLRQLREQHALSGLTPVHRLDKDASGVLLLARSEKAASALQRRWDEVEKTYVALCRGVPPAPAGVIDARILEHQTGKPERLARAVRYYTEKHPGRELPPLPAPKTSAVHPAGRPAQTEYRVVEAFGQTCAWLEVRPRQGRMHQIRVHLAHLGCPIIGDGLYGARDSQPERPCGVVAFERLALHAAKLVFPDPSNASARVTVEAPLPADLAALLDQLRASGHEGSVSSTLAAISS